MLRVVIVRCKDNWQSKIMERQYARILGIHWLRYNLWIDKRAIAHARINTIVYLKAKFSIDRMLNRKGLVFGQNVATYFGLPEAI